MPINFYSLVTFPELCSLFNIFASFGVFPFLSPSSCRRGHR